ncbi:MAG: hypothetical protein L0L17_02255 [Yaniella sp.]|nr:hypothetical protein [Yaniella sp.]
MWFCGAFDRLSLQRAFWQKTIVERCPFHTRTKTGRAPELQNAAPEVWVEMSEGDAEAGGISESDFTEITTPRGTVTAQVRITDIRDGVLFLPFHYGYWDTTGSAPDGPGRAANELTLTDWDPASKQPIFKTAAAQIRRLQDNEPSRSTAQEGSR